LQTLESRKSSNGKSWKTIDTYPYLDASGKPIFFVERKERTIDAKKEKKFVQYRLGENGKKTYNLDGAERVPYLLPQLQAGIAGDEVIIAVEGEKDADALCELGFCSTTNAGGAAWAWTPDFAEHFKGASVVIVADNDEPGRKAARERSQALLGIAHEVRIIETLPAVGEKGDSSDLIAAGWNRQRFVELFELAPLIEAPPPPDPAGLLKDVEVFIRRYVRLGGYEGLATALWVMLSHIVDVDLDVTDCVPYLAITSAEMRCGKTRFLETLEQIVARPWLTGRTTAAVLARKIDKEHPTALFDEMDAAFKGDKVYAETLRGVLNTGYLRSGRVSLCVVHGSRIEYCDLSTFGLKALAGIGSCLPSTVVDRSIYIRLERRLASESVERFRRKRVEKDAQGLRERLQRWAKLFVETTHPEPAGLDDLPDRAADIWEPLLLIAEAAGDPVADNARKAAIALSGHSGEDESRGITALRDIRSVFDELGIDRITSADLARHLAAKEESPWGPAFGHDFDARGLARLLRPFGIQPRTVRFDDDKTAKGYHREYFEPVWMRYLPAPITSPERSSQPSHRHKNALSQPYNMRHVTPVTLVTTNSEDSGEQCA
jgi:hypothetical protein